MRIDSSQLQLNSLYSATTRYTRDEQLDVRLPTPSGQMKALNFHQQHTVESNSLMTYDAIRQQTTATDMQQKAAKLGEQVNAFNQSIEPLNSNLAPDQITSSQLDEEDDFLELSPEDKMKIALIKSLLASLTGKEIEFSITDLRIPKEPGEAISLANPNNTTVDANAISPPEAASLEYQLSETFYQQENSQFQAKGLVKTSDGREIKIDIALNMSRELTQQSQFSLRMGAALKDPLVISFDGRAAELSQQRFEFDLTIDGQKEWIPRLGNNSAFLALDRNGDGKINDGSELFGAKTGDGFKELAQYDDDGNGWIDENDLIFDQLKLWLKPGTGDSQQLVSLREAGIGAIYLGNASTPFTLNNSLGDERLGVIRSTGIYVSEQGKAGIIQHVDLSI